MGKRVVPSSALLYVLQALVPFSDANIKLAFKPHLFFRDLDRIANKPKKRFERAYDRALKTGLIQGQLGGVHVTPQARALLAQFNPYLLDSGIKFMIIFDIPEKDKIKRQALRRVLRRLDFTCLQKSVWTSDYDYTELFKAYAEQQQLQSFLKIYKVTLLS